MKMGEIVIKNETPLQLFWLRKDAKNDAIKKAILKQIKDDPTLIGRNRELIGRYQKVYMRLTK